jgi:hypothetical protein
MLVAVLMAFVLLAALCTFYVKTHPLVFNESFWRHAHCIKQVGLALETYAHYHGGLYPFHTNGYGDALLMLEEESLSLLTGPGYTAEVFQRARDNKTDVPENECGRVYVQGLSETNDGIALLFDKTPSPGDHRHFLSRISAPSVREIWTIRSGMHIIRESEWPAYAKKQIQLLVEAGIPRKQAEAYYSE